MLPQSYTNQWDHSAAPTSLGLSSFLCSRSWRSHGGGPFHSLGPHSRETIFGPSHSLGLHNGGAIGGPSHSLGLHKRGAIGSPFHSLGLHKRGSIGSPFHSLGLPSCLSDLHVLPFSKRETSLVFYLSPLSLVIHPCVPDAGDLLICLPEALLISVF